MLTDQSELTLEDLEAEHAHAACVVAGDVPPEVPQTSGCKPRREPLPAHLPRQEVIDLAPEAHGCTACGSTMSAPGQDVTKVLKHVPARFQVVRHVRPKLACQRCDAISQTPAPSLPVSRSRAGPGLLAHVVMSKFADHLPLYR
jgi:transposase